MDFLCYIVKIIHTVNKGDLDRKVTFYREHNPDMCVCVCVRACVSSSRWMNW